MITSKDRNTLLVVQWGVETLLPCYSIGSSVVQGFNTGRVYSHLNPLQLLAFRTSLGQLERPPSNQIPGLKRREAVVAGALQSGDDESGEAEDRQIRKKGAKCLQPNSI
jgi:hypothetical protein